jgi:hypothetical protein
MSSRLDELRRQRALLQEHLAWLDREIDAAAGDARPPAPVPAVEPARPSPAAPPPTAQAEADAEQLFAQFRAEQEKNAPPPTKAGCWMVFSLILLLFFSGIGVVAYFIYR